MVTLLVNKKNSRNIFRPFKSYVGIHVKFLADPYLVLGVSSFNYTWIIPGDKYILCVAQFAEVYSES